MARVLQLVTELVVGGASLTMLDFAEDLAAEHELVIAHGRLDDPANAAARRARTRFPSYELPRLVRPLDARTDLLAARAFAALCRQLRPDVIHTHSSKAGFVGRLGALPLSGVRLHTIHGWGHTPLDPPRRRGLLIGAERLAALRTTKLIAVSPEVRDEGLSLGIGRFGQYAVIGSPVDMRPHVGHADFESARAQARALLRLPDDAEVIGWVGRFSPQKDPEALVAVLGELLARRHNAYAVLVGDGPQRPVVQAQLSSEIAERRVRLLGVRDDVRALYPAFDVLLHTSRWEGHPRVVREALAERVPVITARVGGTRFVSGDPRLGLELEPGDVGGYCAAVATILDSPQRRAPIDEPALIELRAQADAPYRLMRELYTTALERAPQQRP
jgi:glycosyltransferase involved in cell wall biosynthesis